MTPRSIRGSLASLVLACVLLPGLASPLRAAVPPQTPSVLLAEEGWTWRGLWARFTTFVHNSFRSRARLVQISCVAVAFGLFIMFRARNT